MERVVMKTPLRRGSRSITYCSGHYRVDLVYKINYCCLRVRSGLGSDLFCCVCAKVELASASGGGMDSSPSVRSLLPLFFRLKNVCLAICGIHCSLQTHWAPVTYYVCSGKGERSVPISYERANKLTVTRGRGSKMLQMSHVIGPLHEWRKRDMERWRERGRGGARGACFISD